jgi:hypothetical protein
MEIAIGIAALIIAWLTFQKTFSGEKKDQRKHLFALFGATQSLSKSIKQKLINYAEANDAYETYLFDGITIRSYIRMLTESQEENLSDKLLEDIKNLNMPKATIQSMTKSLEEQNKSLVLVEGMIRALPK